MSHESLIVQPLEDIMGDRFGRYSKYIIQERALPDVRDGLKPVQRRILYAMFHEKNNFDKPYRKSAKTVGIVIGNYHPHGDRSVYDAMVRLSQSWKMNMPLVDMQGNNGSIDNDPAAAMRYTEARLSKLAHELLENIEEDVVPFVLNFDDMTTEPSVLPALFPNLLVNGSTGIAAGYATNIPPFNLHEVLKATMFRLDHPESTHKDIAKFVKGPDFPTGAVIQGAQGIKDMMETGRGRVVVQAKAEIVASKTMKQIVVTELPYEVVKSDVVRKIDDLRFQKAQDGYGDIMDVRDESDRNGLRIVVDCKRDSDAVSILNLLYKNTDLQVYYNANMVAIVDQRPQVCSVLDIIDAFITFRKDVVLRRTQYRLEKKSARLHILEGLILAISVLDEIIVLIRASSNRSEARDNLMEAFAFTFDQASAIVDLQLYRLSSTDITTLKEEEAKLQSEVAFLKSLLNDTAILHQTMHAEFKHVIERFDAPRRSSIEAEISDLEVDHLSLIPNEAMMVTVSRFGYLKKVSLRSYGSSNQSQIMMSDDDMPVFMGEVMTTQYLMIFTNKGRYGLILVHDIEEVRWRDVGTHLNQYMKCEPTEYIVAVYSYTSLNTHRFVVTVSSDGMVKQTALQDFEVKRTNRLYPAMGISKGASLASALIATAEDDVVLLSSTGNALRLSLSDINPVGPKAKGIIGMKLKNDSVRCAAIITKNATEMALMSERGGYKRFKVQELPIMNRNTMGLSIARSVKSNPHLIQSVVVGQLQTPWYTYDDVLEQYTLSAVPLMDFEASFSQMKVALPFTILENTELIPEVAIPKDTEVSKKPEHLSLDV